MSGDDDDDFIASLGTSLMKEILEDLQVDDNDAGWLNLEQLEKELSNLDSSSAEVGGGGGVRQQQQQPEQPFSSAASMVVQQQQQPTTPAPPGAAASLQPIPVQDAWGLSLQKITATSLEEEFLQADTARKQQQQQQSGAAASAPPPPPPGLDLSKAEEYDETVPIGPPPGLAAARTTAAAPLAGSDSKGASSVASGAEPVASTKTESKQQQQEQQELLTQAANKLVQQLHLQDQPSPEASTKPKAVATAAVVEGGVAGGGGNNITGVPRNHPPFTPQNSIVIPSQASAAGTVIPATPPPSIAHTPAQPPKPSTGSAATGPPTMAMPTIPVGVPVGPPVVPRSGPAWHQPPPPPPPPPQMRIFCNPHPRAPPIPANRLESRYMKARDISYVVHSILKPLIMAGIQENSYDVQFYLRRTGAATAAGAKPKTMKESDVTQEMQSRSNRAKEWSSEHATLGHVAKTNVARPRALLAQPVDASAPSNVEQKQRASLWKARIYCDQAYQAFFQVLEGWRSGGAVGASVQTHYAKLFKCLGITPVNKTDATSEGADSAAAAAAADQGSIQQFKVEPTALALLLKLEKGRILLARIFEQALLPPNSVVPLLPATLGILLSPSRSSGAIANDPSDDRLFIAMARIIQTLPNLTGEAALQCIKIIITESSKSSQAALSTTSRMQCVHALLHRGGALSQGGDASFQKEWSQAEAEFMKILTGM